MRRAKIHGRSHAVAHLRHRLGQRQGVIRVRALRRIDVQRINALGKRHFRDAQIIGSRLHNRVARRIRHAHRDVFHRLLKACAGLVHAVRREHHAQASLLRMREGNARALRRGKRHVHRTLGKRQRAFGKAFLRHGIMARRQSRKERHTVFIRIRAYGLSLLVREQHAGVRVHAARQIADFHHDL